MWEENKVLGVCELSPPSTTRWQRTEIVWDGVVTSSLSFSPRTPLCNLLDWLMEWNIVLGLVARALFVFVHTVCLYHYHFFLARLARGEIRLPNGFKKRLDQLFDLIVQKHDATTGIGKFSVGLELIYPVNVKLNLKGCWIVSRLFGRIKSWAKRYNEILACITNSVQ